MQATAPVAPAHNPVLRPPRSHPRVVAPSLHLPETAAGAVFGAIRTRGPIARDAIAGHTGLSTATVNRQVTALLGLGLLRERADLAVSGAVGRPRLPLEVNHEPFLTLGIYIGARGTSIVATDLLGRTLDVVEIATPAGRQGPALAALIDSARRYLSRWHRRQPLRVGVSAGGMIDSTTGYVDHTPLGWKRAPVGPALADALDLPAAVSSHVDAMAGAELLVGKRRPEPATSTTLYVYARETVGYALVIGGRVHSPASGPGTIAGLPASSQLLGGSGQLESTVSDGAVLAAARRLQMVPGAGGARREGPGAALAPVLRAARSGDERAVELLGERARVLGEAVALLRDLLNPDELVVGGQAFTEYPEGLAVVQAACTQRSVLGPRAVRTTAFGNRVQEAGAGAVALGGLYADPVAAMRRVRARRSPV